MSRDKLEDKIDRLLASSERHNVLLAEHERRSIALEVGQIDIRRELKADRETFAAALAPIKIHVAMWGGAGKALTITGALAGTSATLWALLSRFF
jgi:hypothetical protein